MPSPVELRQPNAGSIVFRVGVASETILEIKADGRLFWRGREVETDDDLRKAMVELSGAIVGMSKDR